MAVIPEVASQRELPNMPSPSVATGGAQVGRAISDLGANIQQKNEEDENLYVAKTEAEQRAKYTQTLAKAKADAPPGAPNFTGNILQQYDADTAGIIDNAPSARAKQLLQVKLGAELRGSVASDAITFEATAGVKKKADDVSTMTDLNANAAMNNPAQVDNLYAKNNAAIVASGLQGEDLTKALEASKNTIYKSALNGLNNIDPHAGLAKLNSGEWDDKLDPQAKMAGYNDAQTEIKRRETAARLAQTQARTSIASVKERLTKGDSIPADELSDVQSLVNDSNSPALQNQFKSLLAQSSAIQKWQQLGPVEMQAEVGKMAQAVQAGGATQEERDLLDLAQKTYANMQAGIAQDRMMYAQKAGRMDIGQIFNTNGQLDPAGIQRRISVNEDLNTRYGNNGQILTDPEATSLMQALNTGKVEDQVATARALAQGFGNATPGVFRQLSKKDPSVGYAAALAGQNPEAAQLAFMGRKMKAENPTGIDMGQSADSTVTSYMRDQLGDSLMFAPLQEAAIRDTALDIYRARAATKGYTAGMVDQTGFKEALALATNKTLGEYNGKQTILPSGYTQQKFDSTIKGLSDDMLKAKSATGEAPSYSTGKMVKAADLKAAQFYPVGDGQYWLKIGNGFAYAGGRPYVLDLNKQ